MNGAVFAEAAKRCEQLVNLTEDCEKPEKHQRTIKALEELNTKLKEAFERKLTEAFETCNNINHEIIKRIKNAETTYYKALMSKHLIDVDAVNELSRL